MTQARFVRWSMVAASVALFGCSDAEPACETCGTGGSAATTASTGASCTSTKGTLSGTVYRFAPPGEADSQLAPGASIVLLTAPGATPLYGEADEQGHFEIPLEAGDWLVGAEDATGCYTDDAAPITVDPCAEVEIDLVLAVCTG